MNSLTPYQQKVIDYESHISLTANAGSGKTFVLAKRFVDIAVKHDLNVREIVAITFTDKAAGELYQRISAEIETRISLSTETDKLKILNRLRRQLVSANISTIHSFCINLLKEFAPIVDIDTNFIPLDQNKAAEILQSVIANYLDEKIKLNDNKIKDLIRYFGSTNSMADQFINLFNKRDEIYKLNSDIYSKPKSEISKHFNDLFEEKANLYFSDKCVEFVNVLERLNNELLEINSDNEKAIYVAEIIPEIRRAKSFKQKFRLLNNLTQTIFVNKKDTLRKKEYLNKVQGFDNEIESIEKIQKVLSKIEVEKDNEVAEDSLAYYGAEIIDVFVELDGIYQSESISKGYLDFEQILLKTIELLQNEVARNIIADKFKFIMVDEYQDTNEIQLKIILPLLSDLTKGNLFVVGDEKQSIYMFRGADLAVFQNTKNKISELTNNNGLMSLPHSFRLAPHVALFANIIFSKLFENPDYEFNEVESDDLICSREMDETGEVEFLIAEDSEESELISAKILQLIEDGKQFHEIAILCKKRADFFELTKCFLKHGIPYQLIGSKGFYQNQVIYDIYNYLRFLLNPNDDIALLAVLRSPFYLISDNDLLAMKFEKGSSYFEKLKNLAVKKVDLSKIVESLDSHISLVLNTSISIIINTILVDTGYLAVESQASDSVQNIANINKLISIASKYDDEPLNNLYDFVNQIKKSINSIDDEGLGEIQSIEGKVNILTVHQSKGLQFDTVFLFNTNKPNPVSQVKSNSIVVDKKFGIMLKTPDLENHFNNYISAPIISLFNYYLSQKASAESKRLLYVAVTRTINNLYISAKKEKGIKSNSFIGFILNGLTRDLNADQIEIGGDLKFIQKTENGYNDTNKLLRFNIPITKNIEQQTTPINNEELKRRVKINIEPVNDISSNEIISATKIAIYSQCPVKYKLTYEMGLSKLIGLISTTGIKSDFTKEDEDADLPGNIVGTVIHKALEMQIQPKYSADFFKDELKLIGFGNSISNEEIDSITGIYKDFCNSDIFADINSYQNTYQEYEIYLKEENYYLFGIIDKIIFDDKKLIIVDYKTDTLTGSNQDSKFDYYANQLLFYAYLAANYFNEFRQFEVRLVFVKKPEASVVKLFNREELNNFGSKIKEYVTKIYNQNFEKNIEHCNKCIYASNNGECILK